MDTAATSPTSSNGIFFFFFPLQRKEGEFGSDETNAISATFSRLDAAQASPPGGATRSKATPGWECPTGNPCSPKSSKHGLGAQDPSRGRLGAPSVQPSVPGGSAVPFIRLFLTCQSRLPPSQRSQMWSDCFRQNFPNTKFQPKADAAHRKLFPPELAGEL